jgi:hypothetical protein
MLCQCCRRIFDWDEDLWYEYDDLISFLKEGILKIRKRTLRRWKQKVSTRPVQLPETLDNRAGPFHDSGQALEASAKAGCEICRKVWAYFDHDERAELLAWKLETGASEENSSPWFWVTGSGDDLMGLDNPCVAFVTPGKVEGREKEYKQRTVLIYFWDVQGTCNPLLETRGSL